MDWHTRLTLAIGILDGEKDAHRILADLLDESGDRALAEWCRARKSKRRKRLEIVLGVVPHRMAIRLAAEFIRHANSDTPEQYERLGLPVEAVEFLCVWAGGPKKRHCSLKSLQEALDLLNQERHDRSFAEDYQHFVEFPWLTGVVRDAAVGLAEAAEFSLQADLPEVAAVGKTAHFASMAGTLARRVARNSTILSGRNPTNELPWQIKHTRRVIEEFLHTL